MKDLVNNVGPLQSLVPLRRTASVNGTGVDLRGFNAAAVLIDVGLWTDGTHTFEVQDSDDDSTYAAVVDAELDGAEPVILDGTNDNQIHKIGYKGGKRYLRVITTVSGTTTGADYGASILRGSPAQAPVA